MRYLIAIALVIIGTTVGFLAYRAWTAGPPVVLPAPARLSLASGGVALRPKGWTNGSTVNLDVGERTSAGADVEVRRSDETFSNNPTQSVSTATGCSHPACTRLQLHLSDGQWHLQTRLHNDRGVSPWVPYGQVIRVDTTPPPAPQISSSTDPHPGQTYHSSTTRFAWHTSDAGSGLTGYGYRLDTDPHGTPQEVIRVGTPAVALTGLATGRYFFHVRARDVAGNWGPTSTFPVTIDVTPPQLASYRFSSFRFNPQYNSLSLTFSLTKPARWVHVGVYRQSDHYLTRLLTLRNIPAHKQMTVWWNGKGPLGRYVTPGSYEVYVRTFDRWGHSSVNGWRDLVLDYKRIYVSLNQQRLWAYDGNSLFLSSLVTTGNPALPTPKGTFQLLAKFHPFTFHSPWPKSSPYWYPPSLTQWAMLFQSGGYFIHDAPWRSNFGPGSNTQLGTPGNNYTGTHGCVNVPPDVAYRLFQWAGVGTVVQVGN